MLVYMVQNPPHQRLRRRLQGHHRFSGRAFGLTLLVTALAWVGGQVKQSLTSRMLYVDPEPSVPQASRRGGLGGDVGAGLCKREGG